MPWLPRIRWLSRLLFGRRDFESELDTEVQSYFEILLARQVQQGVTVEEARRLIRMNIEGPERVKEKVREALTGAAIISFARDMKYALRQLSRNPGFMTVAVITLAIGIGATTAIFSVVNGVVLKPLAYPDPDRLVNVGLNLPGINQSNLPLSRADYFIFREQSRTFQDIGLYEDGIDSTGEPVDVTGFGEPEHVLALDVTDGLLPILGVTPLFGRSFTRADDSPGSAETVILTYSYWRSKLGGDRSVIGRTIDVDGKPRAIIGVLPQHFRFLDKSKLAMLLPMKLDRTTSFLGHYGLGAIARLKPAVTLAQATADVARMIPIVLRSFPPPPGYSLKMFEDLRIGPNLRPLKQEVVGDVDGVLWVLMGGISLVLLIACANVANLLLLRAEGRQQELAIRAALGASRSRIAAELFSESLILGMLGGVLGLGLAYGALRVLIEVAPTGLPRLNEIGIDGKIICLRSQSHWPRACFSVPSLSSSIRVLASERDCERADVP